MPKQPQQPRVLPNLARSCGAWLNNQRLLLNFNDSIIPTEQWPEPGHCVHYKYRTLRNSKRNTEGTGMQQLRWLPRLVTPKHEVVIT